MSCRGERWRWQGGQARRTDHPDLLPPSRRISAANRDAYPPSRILPYDASHPRSTKGRLPVTASWRSGGAAPAACHASGSGGCALPVPAASSGEDDGPNDPGSLDQVRPPPHRMLPKSVQRFSDESMRHQVSRAKAIGFRSGRSPRDGLRAGRRADGESRRFGEVRERGANAHVVLDRSPYRKRGGRG
jgi:hypothetical protein